MGRTPGSRNADYEEQRQELARKVMHLVLSPEGVSSSLRGMAAASGVSVATLKHYFGDREGVLRGVIEAMWRQSLPYLAIGATPSSSDVRASLREMLTGLRTAWFTHGVGKLQSTSLGAGLVSPALGPAYIERVMEPLLQMAEARLRRHVEQGELSPVNPRYAALELLAPVVLGLLHQDSLSGASCRPLDLDDFLERHLDTFLLAHPVTRSVEKGTRRGGAPAR